MKSLVSDLLAAARTLAKANPGRPRQAYLRRAVSTAYFALFHALAQDCADQLVGRGSSRSTTAWVQAYRALEHGFAKNACKGAEKLGFSSELVHCANEFIELQQARHDADYDPQATFLRAEVLDLVNRAQVSIEKLHGARTADRRAFAVLLLLKRRTS